MAYEQKENSGAIFKNDKREKDTQPHGKGSALIDGVAYWVSSWTNESPKGRYQSLKFERKDSKPESKPSTPAQSKPSGGVMDDMADDLPFLFNANTLCDTMGAPTSYWRARYGKELSLVRANQTDF